MVEVDGEHGMRRWGSCPGIGVIAPASDERGSYGMTGDTGDACARWWGRK